MFFSVNSWGTQTLAFIPSRFNRCKTFVWAMLQRSAISRVVRCRSTLIADKIWISGGWTTGAGSIDEIYISLERNRANQRWQVSAFMAESPYTPHIWRCASVAFNPFRKKNNKMCRKCTILSSIFNEYCAHKTRRNWINSSVRCQAFSNLSNGMRQFAIRATHVTFFSERTPSSEKTAELNEQLNI